LAVKSQQNEKTEFEKEATEDLLPEEWELDENSFFHPATKIQKESIMSPH